MMLVHLKAGIRSGEWRAVAALLVILAVLAALP